MKTSPTMKTSPIITKTSPPIMKTSPIMKTAPTMKASQIMKTSPTMKTPTTMKTSPTMIKMLLKILKKQSVMGGVPLIWTNPDFDCFKIWGTGPFFNKVDYNSSSTVIALNLCHNNIFKGAAIRFPKRGKEKQKPQ